MFIESVGRYEIRADDYDDSLRTADLEERLEPNRRGGGEHRGEVDCLARSMMGNRPTYTCRQFANRDLRFYAHFVSRGSVVSL